MQTATAAARPRFQLGNHYNPSMSEPEAKQEDSLLPNSETAIALPNWKSAIANFSIIAILFPIVVATLKVLFVSQGDPAVTSSIISTLNVKAAVLGVVLTIVPSAAILWITMLWLPMDYKMKHSDYATHKLLFWRLLIFLSVLLLALYSTVVFRERY
jgi:hypothetical protein